MLKAMLRCHAWTLLVSLAQCDTANQAAAGTASTSQTRGGGGDQFIGATFGGVAGFNEATFEGDARFDDAIFGRAQQLGPMLIRKSLALNRALFHERIEIEVSTEALSCIRTRFLAGVQLRVRWAQVVLDGADLAAPSVLSSANAFPNLPEGDWPVSGKPWPVDTYGTPRLLSVRGADVAGLTVAGVDMRACRFVDAHHLDHLRAEGSNFANTGGWRWTKRQTIAEEHQWRRASHDAKGWYQLENQPPDWFDLKARSAGPAGLFPEDIARLYRELRKGLEDKKDEPGAADFYYGEMEMRRHAQRQSRPGLGGLLSFWGERIVITAYWLVSGYGLRASRAFLALAASIALGAALLDRFGFVSHKLPEQGPLLFALESSISLLRVPEGELTARGHVIQIVLRLLGPLSFGLALLALRGRVKR